MRHVTGRDAAARLLLTLLMVAGIVLCGVAASVAASVGTALPVAAGPGAMPTLAGGYSFSLVVAADGTLWSMGLNNNGQLGQGDYAQRLTPTQVGSATNWKAVDAQWWHSMGVRSDGTLWGWGRNGDGQLGLGYVSSAVTSPAQVGSATNWVAVSTGQSHSLGLRSDGTLWAWGDNTYGQLGLGDTTERLSPTQVGSRTDWTAVSGRWNHSLAIRSDGTLWAWGYNGYGELGLGHKFTTYSPTQVGAATNWKTIATDLSYSLGIRSNGTLWSWGYNYKGILGLGDETDRLVPTQVGSATNWLAVAPGRVHCLGLRKDGTLWGWGSNYEGETGVGYASEKVLAPTQGGSATNWLAVAAGDAHSIGWRTDGTLWGWGRNQYGELGIGGTATMVLVPTQASLSTELPLSVVTLVAGNVSTTGATLNGNLTGLGSASSAQVSFQWGLTTSYGNTTTPQTKTGTGGFSFALSGLSPQTTYHFRARAVGDTTVYGGDIAFTTATPSTTPPTVTTGDASNVGLDSAQLNGNLTALGTATSVSVSFQMGTLPGVYGYETTPQVRNATGAFQHTLSSLAGGTTYYYRAKADGDGVPVYGAEKSFTTATPPAVTTGNASSVTATSAILNGNLTGLGTASSVSVSFQMGTSPGVYGFETTPEARYSVGTFQVSVSSLASGTTYYYRARAVGSGTGYGVEKSFITATPPAVTTGDASGVTTISATLNGDLSSLGGASSVSVSFQWGTSPGVYGSETTPEVKNATGAFQFNLIGLTGGTTYYYRAKAAGDGTGYGMERSLTTAALPVVTTGDASSVSTSSARMNGNLVSLGAAGSIAVSFVWGTSPGSYPQETTVQVMMSAGAFYFDLNGLTPGATYYYKARASGGEAIYGVEKSFTTGRIPAVSAASPDSGKRGQVLTVTISGGNFEGASAVSFGPGIVVRNFAVNGGTGITAEIAIDAAAEPGARDVSVTTGWGTAAKAGGFKVAGGGGGVCGGGTGMVPGAPSEMTVTLAALGALFGVWYWVVRQRRGWRVRARRGMLQNAAR